jgi:hypothetical protein
MKTVKGNKKELIKEYKNFCNDLKLIKHYLPSIEYFTHNYIEHNIKTNGLFHNDFFKTIEIDEVNNEIFEVLRKEFIKYN